MEVSTEFFAVTAAVLLTLAVAVFVAEGRLSKKERRKLQSEALTAPISHNFIFFRFTAFLFALVAFFLYAELVALLALASGGASGVMPPFSW